MKGRSALSSIISSKCPRCREGNLFTHRAYDLKHFGKMYDTCSECGLRFEREPGFFYGAMYVSYGLSVGIFLITVFTLYILANDPALEVYLVAVTLMALLLYPLTLRYARVLFLNIFGGVKYRGVPPHS